MSYKVTIVTVTLLITFLGCNFKPDNNDVSCRVLEVDGLSFSTQDLVGFRLYFSPPIPKSKGLGLFEDAIVVQTMDAKPNYDIKRMHEDYREFIKKNPNNYSALIKKQRSKLYVKRYQCH